MIDKRVFAKFSDRIMMYPILMEEIDELNNKVGSVKVSYALCRHYYDKGIPDKPYYISPGKDGQSVQYLYPFLRRWCQKAYINIGTFRKEMSIHFGTVYQSFFVVSKSVHFRTKERSE